MTTKFKTLKDHVYDYIAEQIALGNLSPEEKINESSICEELSISRTPVREALIQLASEGILDNVPRKGFVVKNLSEEEARELYAIIGTLDGLAATLACPKLDEQDYRDMQFYIEKMDYAIDAQNFEMYMTQQKAFHNVYTEKCGNKSLIEYLEKMENKFLKGYYSDVEQSQSDLSKKLKAINSEHSEILRLLKEKNTIAIAQYLYAVHWSPAYPDMQFA